MTVRFNFQNMKVRAHKSKKARAYKAGLWAESLAALYLRLKGYQILARRFKTPFGEIDLIAAKKDLLVAVEVKTRSTLDQSLEAVSAQNCTRVENAAACFLAQNPAYGHCTIRYDIMAVVLRYGFWPRQWKHLDNAWEART